MIRNKYLLEQISVIYDVLEESLNLNDFLTKDVGTRVKHISKIIIYY